ncbi:hypothetical protein [Rhodanobacter hydrolyticus]|uniref:Uncharacterized protein n=1 Tax=Rhodanobacter hydrolyticus TaxID=2250595 RepID=A0ABW8J3N1_9GAMM
MININLPKVPGVVLSTPDGLYEVIDHGVEGKIQIVGVNAMLFGDQLRMLADAGYILNEAFEMERDKSDGDLLVPKIFTAYIFATP